MAKAKRKTKTYLANRCKAYEDGKLAHMRGYHKPGSQKTRHKGRG